MSKKFKEQDYFRYPRLGRKWRKPRGRQSKLRLRKGGSGIRPSIGRGKERKAINLVRGLRLVNVSSAGQIAGIENAAILISGPVGMKKTLEIYNAAKEKGLKVLNMKKVKKALKKEKDIQKKLEEKRAKSAKQEKKEEKEVAKEKAEKIGD